MEKEKKILELNDRKMKYRIKTIENNIVMYKIRRINIKKVTYRFKTIETRNTEKLYILLMNR